MIDKKIEEIIKCALDEDIQTGDITTEAIVPYGKKGEGTFLIKEEGIIAGFDIVEKTFHLFDPELKFTKNFNDGDKVKPGDIAATVEGNISSILTTERTALNFFQRMSGIATLANNYNEQIKHTRAKLVDTRKTVPGLRLIDKLAVKLSGCENHRMGLYDMFLIKDNHIESAGSISDAVSLCKKYRNEKNADFKIEVETKNLSEVKEAIESNVDRIMLDNFTTEKMKEAVDLINGRCEVEASGGIGLNTIKDIAETGVDLISAGALTHSVKALDISLNINLKNT